MANNIRTDVIYKNAEHKVENSSRLIKMYVKQKDIDAAITETELLLNRLNMLYEQLNP